jgi:putative hydrolase of the HAD superfamily
MEPVPPPPLPPEWEGLVYSGSVPAAPGVSRSPPSSSPALIRAVLFDVYGTLFCSAAGDIGTVSGLDRTGGILADLVREYAPALTGEKLRDYFRGRVREIHGEFSAKTPYPEVRVEEIWARFLRESGSPPPCPENGEGDRMAQARELALRYELAVNPVCPMPGAGETVARLQKAGCILGIISNAQFFTPLLFAAFLGGLPEKIGFDPALLVYSFEMGEAKPAARLFGRAADRLAERGISPEQCLYVGNDMLTDIYGASSAGFQGVLFAGDGRSLRLREQDERIRGLAPFRIIRRLADLLPLAVNSVCS